GRPAACCCSSCRSAPRPCKSNAYKTKQGSPWAALFRFVHLQKVGLASYLPVAVHNVFVTAQFGQAHGAAGMQFLGRNPHFAAKAKLSAVGKTGGSVHIHSRAVHTGGKTGGGSAVL